MIEKLLYIIDGDRAVFDLLNYWAYSNISFMINCISYLTSLFGFEFKASNLFFLTSNGKYLLEQPHDQGDVMNILLITLSESL